jgi:hypothetical protein
MKKILHIILLPALLLMLASCGEQRSVKRVARAFLQSYYVNNDFETAKQVSTEDTHETLDFKAMMFMLNPNSESESINTFKIIKVEAKKTKAICIYEVIGAERRLNFSKVNGKWLVDMPENASIEPGLSLSQSRDMGGFTSAMSDPIKLKDVPEAPKK